MNYFVLPFLLSLLFVMMCCLLDSTTAFSSSSRVVLGKKEYYQMQEGRKIQQTGRYYACIDTSLASKKKKAPAAAPKKVQVKLLHHVAGTGQAGDVIQVTPAFFNNKLRPTKLAKIISDDEVAQEKAQREETESANKAKAIELQSKLNETTLEITRKTGPDGKLFGGIGPKVIMEELKNVINDDYLTKQKSVKVSESLDENGKKIRGDFKKIGSYSVRIALSKDISAKVGINIESE